ncbi:hypothetical protein Y699_06334 [Aspergillus fumigatus Z5]|nr:hypothetical protein Y699_06334 [Aspergillus fumigatus Z5]
MASAITKSDTRSSGGKAIELLRSGRFLTNSCEGGCVYGERPLSSHTTANTVENYHHRTASALIQGTLEPWHSPPTALTYGESTTLTAPAEDVSIPLSARAANCLPGCAQGQCFEDQRPMDELRQFNQDIVDAFDVKQTGVQLTIDEDLYDNPQTQMNHDRNVRSRAPFGSVLSLQNIAGGLLKAIGDGPALKDIPPQIEEVVDDPIEAQSTAPGVTRTLDTQEDHRHSNSALIPIGDEWIFGQYDAWSVNAPERRDGPSPFDNLLRTWMRSAKRRNGRTMSAGWLKVYDSRKICSTQRMRAFER